MDNPSTQGRLLVLSRSPENKTGVKFDLSTDLQLTTTHLPIFEEGHDPQKNIVPDAIALQLEVKSIVRSLIEGLREVHCCRN